jgi:DNA-directed RNA polymerase omega subunit
VTQFSTLDQLVRQHSRYLLVVAVAKRARQLTEQGADVERSTKAVTQALDEIANGSVAVADIRVRYG